MRKTLLTFLIIFMLLSITTITVLCPAVSASSEEWVYLGVYRTTGYDLCRYCCGKTDGITASGVYATVGRTCAAPRNISFGTRLYIEGVGYRTVEDRGGAINGKKLDILCSNHPDCYAITGWRKVWIIKSQ